MKGRIVINIDKDICSNCEVNKEYCCGAKEEIIDCIITNGKYKEEQVPETFKEFKEMCKIEDISECDDEVKIQWHNNTCLYFYEKDGEIICKDEDSCIEMIIGYDRSPQQMWETLNSLGKEK